MTPFLAGSTQSLVAPEARLSRYGVGGTSYPFAHDPRHERAYRRVEHGADDWADVRGIDGRTVTFRAWRVSADTFAWQTAIMGAPAFMPYAPHDPPEADSLGRYCPGCREPLPRVEPMA